MISAYTEKVLHAVYVWFITAAAVCLIIIFLPSSFYEADGFLLFLRILGVLIFLAAVHYAGYIPLGVRLNKWLHAVDEAGENFGDTRQKLSVQKFRETACRLGIAGDTSWAFIVLHMAAFILSELLIAYYLFYVVITHILRDMLEGFTVGDYRGAFSLIVVIVSALAFVASLRFFAAAKLSLD